MRFDPKEEGITHINIYSRSNSTLGRILSNWSPCGINTCLGKFLSIEGLIYYMGSFDESLRSVCGYEAKQLGEKLDRNIRLPEDVFKRIIIGGMESKIEALMPPFRKEFIRSVLPLTHYYIYGTKVVEIPKWQWQVDEWERIRTDLKT